MEEEWQHQTSSPSRNWEQKKGFNSLQRNIKHRHAHAYTRTHTQHAPWTLGSELRREFPGVLASSTAWKECNNTDPSPDKKTTAGGQRWKHLLQGFQLQGTNCHIWVNSSGSKHHRMQGKWEYEKPLHWDWSSDGWTDTLRTKAIEYGGS